MMRFAPWALILLTQLNGDPVWVESKQVQIIRLRAHDCAEGTGAVIAISTRVLCVKETPDQIRQKIMEAEDRF